MGLRFHVSDLFCDASHTEEERELTGAGIYGDYAFLRPSIEQNQAELFSSVIGLHCLEQ